MSDYAEPAAKSKLNSATANLGVHLRHARLVAGYTLLQLSQRAECSESLISKIERGVATPSLAMLHRLATALDTNIGALTSEQQPSGGPILRKGERPIIKGGSISLERIGVPTPGALLQANIHIVPPKGASDGQIVHTGEEIGYVLEGQIELELGVDRYRLGPGDAFLFSSQTPHGYRNIGADTARILWVNSPATY
jgi:transcriptional regulator with XRE-family HTH domain